MTEPTLHDALNAYLAERFWADDQLLQDLRADIAARAPRINISAEAGAALATFVHAIKATRILEVGTLFGYSGTWLARALPRDGHLDTLELSPMHAEAARGWFDRAGLGDRVTVHLGDAGKTLAGLQGPYDLVFIDADKEGYPSYLEHALRLLRPGGLVLADNIFQRGRLADSDEGDSSVQGIRTYVERIASDPRLHSTVLPLGDGLSLSVVSAS
jgi:caffeoyl-CoA O-methyltransferase